MGSFVYIARDGRGLRQEGVVPAPTSNVALEVLRHRGLTPVSIEESAVPRKRVRRQEANGRRVTSTELAALSWQLSTMIEGGVAIMASLEIVSGETANPQLKTMLHRTLALVSEGRSLSDGFREFPHIFGQIPIAIIVAGETSGNLARALGALAEHFENREKLIRKIRGAMAYPVFALVLVTTIISAIMIFIVPRFQMIFSQLGGRLPALTRGFMFVHGLISHNLPYLVVGGAILAAGGVLFVRTPRGHEALSRFVLRVPLFGRLASEAFLAMFCRTMAMLLESGVPVLEAFEILRGMTRNNVINDAIGKTKEHVTSGSNIAVSMAAAGFFPHMVIKMTQVGEESGSLPAILQKTSEHYERRLGATIDTMTALLEPALIVIIGAVVLLSVVALYLPVFALSNSAG